MGGRQLRPARLMSPVRCLKFAVLIALGGDCAHGQEARPPESAMKSPVKKDETVTLFTTAAWPSAARPGSWEVEIKGVIFEEENRPFLSAAVVKMLNLDPDSLSDAEKKTLAARVALFLVDNESGKEIPVSAGAAGSWRMPESSPGGHFSSTVTISDSVLEAAKSGPGLGLHVVMPPDDARLFSGTVCVVADSTDPLVISDIDDTIKVTAVRDREEAKRNTFCRPFRAVDGMASVYQAWQERGAAFCYVSGSPWQLYRPLEEFRQTAGFPAGAWHLKHVRLMDPATVAALFGPQMEYKLAGIEPLLARWPRRPVVLVGDSGEQDPEIYGTLGRRYPDRIARILIRNVTAEPASAPRFVKAFEGVPAAKWQLFETAGELPRRLAPE